MINWKRVETLRAEIGDADLDEVVTLFLEEVEEVLDRLPRPAPPRQREADLHFLKGSALNLGFADLAAACQRDEARAARGENIDPKPIIGLYSASKRAFMAGPPPRLDEKLCQGLIRRDVAIREAGSIQPGEQGGEILGPSRLDTDQNGAEIARRFL